MIKSEKQVQELEEEGETIESVEEKMDEELEEEEVKSFDGASLFKKKNKKKDALCSEQSSAERY